ncbi:MAG TPA: type 4a pilus biogenesis protein PilO [Actinomycetota bacterium]|jgi:Tfp pilus assembly protein PilO|nr:type 4a pilus biogenesis protein PilO [Actinomycetota bacterium]
MNRRAPIVAAAIAVVVALLLVFLLVLPKMREVGEAEDQLQAAQDQEIALAAELRALQQAQEQAPETEQEIAAIDDAIPPTADLPALFRLLDSAASRAAVDFFSFTPGTPVVDPTSQYSTISSQVTVTGGYFAIDEFLFLLETLPRAAKVTTIAVTGTSTTEETTTSSLQLQMTVEFFTTDTSAGPGSIPGPSVGTTTTEVGA